LNSIKDAELSLANARISLQELFKSPDESRTLQAKNNITQSTESLAVSEKELENLKVSQENARTKASQDIENARKDLETAKKNLEILVREKEQSLGNTVSTKNTTIKNTEDSFKTYLLEIEKMNTDADYIL
jgi:F0F1-type ATP synthase membrane subunit b/b'